MSQNWHTAQDGAPPSQVGNGGGRSAHGAPKGGRDIRVGLVNNMPDAALRRTEEQFASLLQAAGEGMQITLEYHALPLVPRAEQARLDIAARYEPPERLWNDPPDVLIITGTEPVARDLRDEPYWKSLARLFDHAERREIPAMLSCLAAHAAVLHRDGVERRPLERKCFGVFRHDVARGHALMEGAGASVWLPHTRWNRVDEAALERAGYAILARSDEAGVGLFTQDRGSRWLFCQGHPEYDEANLLREYRRDVKRFLDGERAGYPDLPESYFDAADTERLLTFGVQAQAGGRAELSGFPTALAGGRARHGWRGAATRIFANWLDHVAGGSARAQARAAGAPATEVGGCMA